jgi:hypothetical protein
MKQWKKIVVGIVSAGVLQSQAFALDSDKAKHLAAGTAIYGLCVGIGHVAELEWLDYKTCLIPVGIAAVGKEIYDDNTGGDADWADAGATVALPVAIAGFTYVVYEW